MPRTRKPPIIAVPKNPNDLISAAQKSLDTNHINRLYSLCTDISPPIGGWFGLIDCFGRAIRSVFAFYYLVITHPISFFQFSLAYNYLWYGKSIGYVLTIIFYFAWPFAVLLQRILLKLKNIFCFKKSFDDGNVFFIAPSNPLGSLMWDFYKEFSVYTSLFIMCGNHQLAIDHSWYDHITQKKFWRDHLQGAGAHVPSKFAEWNNRTCTWLEDGNDSDVVGDVVIKLPDSFLGIGDLFLAVGETEGYTGTRKEIEDVLVKNYSKGEHYREKGTFVLEWVRPASGQEVHSLDILTVVAADGSVELASCLYWGKCADGKSTHSSKAGYTCDVMNEKILAPASWYSAYFENEMGNETIDSKVAYGCGTSLPGLRKICADAVKTHENILIEQPWLRMAGWDVLIAKNGPTFFEGNFAAHRIPRRIFLTWTNMFYFLSSYRSPL
jgi:hypothetical protein